jgi:hypothetical protein
VTKLGRYRGTALRRSRPAGKKQPRRAVVEMSDTTEERLHGPEQTVMAMARVIDAQRQEIAELRAELEDLRT